MPEKELNIYIPSTSKLTFRNVTRIYSCECRVYPRCPPTSPMIISKQPIKMWINGRWTFCQRLLRANTKPLKLALHVLEISSCGGTPLAPYHLSTSPPPITSRRGYILLCFSKTSSHPPPSFYCTGTPRVTFARLFTVNLLAPGFLPVKGRLERTVNPCCRVVLRPRQSEKAWVLWKRRSSNLAQRYSCL